MNPWDYQSYNSPLFNKQFQIIVRWYHYLARLSTNTSDIDIHKDVESNIEQVLPTTPHETPTIRPLSSHHENYTS